MMRSRSDLEAPSRVLLAGDTLTFMDVPAVATGAAGLAGEYTRGSTWGGVELGEQAVRGRSQGHGGDTSGWRVQ